MNFGALFRTTPLLAAAFATGCSILPQAQPVQMLDPRPTPPASGPAAEWSLRVARPESDPARDSARVLVRTSTARLQVLPEARWVAPAPELVRTLIIRHLRDTGALDRVETTGADADRALRTDLRRFELTEAGAGGLTAAIEIELRLFDSPGAGMIARRLVAHDARAASAAAPDVLAAFEAVLDRTLAEITEWLLGQPRPAHGE